jgi:hypothetical protein
LKTKASSLFDNILSIELPTITLPEFPDIQSRVSGLWDSISLPDFSFPDFSNLNPFKNLDQKLNESTAFDILNLGERFGVDLNIGNKLKSGLMSIFGGERAMGGPVRRGGAYLVGEHGPELFMPRATGFIVPNNNTSAMRTQAVANGSVAATATQPAPIVINAPSSNTNISGGSGGRGRIIPMNIADNDPTLRAIAANTF